MTQNNSTPIWKWIIEFALGVPAFLAIYVFLQNATQVASTTASMVMLLFSAAALIGLFLLWTRLFEKEWRTDLLTKSPARNITVGMAVGVLYFVVISAVLASFGCYNASYAHPAWHIILLNFLFYLLIACGEEVIFRGIIFRMIDERFGFWWALVVSALIFGFIHLITPNASIWSAIAIVIEAGVLLGAAFKYSGGLWLPIGIHWAWNFTQGNVFGFSVSGHDKEESILNSLISGPDILTGGEYGPEASIISVVIGCLLSAYFIWKYLKKRTYLKMD